jgi:hypothetical protein
MVAALSAQLMIESSENSSWLLIEYSPTTGEITMTSVRTSNEMNADVTSIDFSAATGGPALSLTDTVGGQPSELAKIFVRTLPESYKKHGEIPFVHLDVLISATGRSSWLGPELCARRRGASPD